MNILAIESSSKKLIVGLYIGNDILKLSSSKINDTANALPLLTKQILKNSSLKHTDLDAVCISTGPGSFTSLRIGMSYAKGLSMSLDIPIIPISTFQSLIHNFTDDNIHILIYSHGKTFYLCDYKRKNNIFGLANGAVFQKRWGKARDMRGNNAIFKRQQRIIRFYRLLFRYIQAGAFNHTLF